VELAKQIKTSKEIEKNFLFITNQTLRSNLAIILRYVAFLVLLQEQEKIRGSISYSLFKDAILHIGAMVEGLLHYGLTQYVTIKNLNPEDVYTEEWKLKDPKVLIEVSKDERAIGSVQVRSFKQISNSAQFIDLIRSARKAKLITLALFNRLEKLRKLRNKIHIAGLEKADDYYSKTELIFAIDLLEDMVEVIKKKLSK
jgi:hypothetical protein